MAKLRIAVIGAGHMGRYHAEKFAACKDAELVAIVDTDPARAGEIAGKLNSRAAGIKDVLGAIDAAVIATPTTTHHDIALACLEAGVHLLVEKPVTATLEQADRLLELAARKSLVLQVGHLQRFNPAFQALAAQAGKPLFIDIERLAAFTARSTDIDVVLDLMIHDLDLVFALARAPVERLSAAGFRVLTETIDIANARIEFADGCVASLSASRVSQSPVRKLRVFRHDGYISADLQGQALRRVRRGGTGVEESEQGFARADELQAQAEAFVRAARGEEAPLVSGAQGRQALALALQVRQLVEERLARYAT